MMGWQWHQLNHMQIICTSLQTDNQTTTTVPHHSVLQAGCPLCHPTNNIKALKAETLYVTTNTKTDHVQDVPRSQSLSIVLKKLNLTQQKTSKPKDITRMWANAQPDGRPAEHRWRPLFNAAKFG